jgi:hypothetical protein
MKKHKASGIRHQNGAHEPPREYETVTQPDDPFSGIFSL